MKFLQLNTLYSRRAVSGVAKPHWSTLTPSMHHLLTYTHSSIFEVVLNGQNRVKTMPGAPGGGQGENLMEERGGSALPVGPELSQKNI